MVGPTTLSLSTRCVWVSLWAESQDLSRGRWQGDTVSWGPWESLNQGISTEDSLYPKVLFD